MGLLGAGALSAVVGWRPRGSAPEFRIRTITAGVELRSADDLDALRTALDFLSVARSRLGESFEVQTARIATTPLPRWLPGWMSASGLASVRRLDRFVAESGSPFSIGPVLAADRDVPGDLAGFGSWAADLVEATATTSFSASVASPERGIHPRTLGAAAEAISAIARTTPGGEGNFRFCATAFCPPGTPFFPAAYHRGPRAFGIGLESPGILQGAVDGRTTFQEAERSIRRRLSRALEPVEAVARRLSRETGWRYLGIDTSPAPGLDASIGRVIETLAGAPFGSPATLSACAAITGALQGLDVRTCGYSGLMLPVLEDRVLAARAAERRYGVSELLLYSSVCGTGLDVVPLPGEVSVQALADTIRDVAALAVRYEKPLSARLFPVPGKRAGEVVEFESPLLAPSRVMGLG